MSSIRKSTARFLQLKSAFENLTLSHITYINTINPTQMGQTLNATEDKVSTFINLQMLTNEWQRCVYTRDQKSATALAVLAIYLAAFSIVHAVLAFYLSSYFV
ncbi:MAG: hypothetical protein O3B01_23085 [Planctomycetota bacterium]|nr:hypothetical protein [Planctomycetota bacterium]